MTLVGKALVAESQPLNRAGMALMLKHQVGFAEVIQESDFGPAQETLVATPAIAFAAFDIELPDLRDLAPLRRLRLARPDLRIVILSSSVDRRTVLAALDVGVHGVIPRTLSTVEMVNALSAVVNGHIYVPALVSDVTQQAAPLRREAPAERTLTERQQQVLELLAVGKSNKEIGRALRIAEGTVKVHVTAAFRLLGVRNRLGAIIALRSGSSLHGSPDPVIPGLFAEARRWTDRNIAAGAFTR